MPRGPGGATCVGPVLAALISVSSYDFAQLIRGCSQIPHPEHFPFMC